MQCCACVQKHEDAAADQQRALVAGPGFDPLPPQQQQADGTTGKWQYEKGCWEAFHARDNATARFYKERRSGCACTMMQIAVVMLYAI